ncbi:MAG: DUF1877 family protein [Archangium sp.]
MSVMGYVVSVSKEDVEWLRTHEVVWGDDVEEEDDERDVFDNPSVEIGKITQGVHHLLCGGDTKKLASFLLNEALGEKTKHEFAYGPGRLFSPDELAALRKELDAIPDDEIEKRSKDDVLATHYPFNGTRDVDSERLVDTADEVIAFVGSMKRGRWLLVAHT